MLTFQSFSHQTSVAAEEGYVGEKDNSMCGDTLQSLFMAHGAAIKSRFMAEFPGALFFFQKRIIACNAFDVIEVTSHMDA